MSCVVGGEAGCDSGRGQVGETELGKMMMTKIIQRIDHSSDEVSESLKRCITLLTFFSV